MAPVGPLQAPMRQLWPAGALGNICICYLSSVCANMMFLGT